MKKSILLLFVLPFLVFLGSYSGGNLISYFGSISQMKYDGSKSLYDGDMNTTLNNVNGYCFLRYFKKEINNMMKKMKNEKLIS